MKWQFGLGNSELLRANVLMGLGSGIRMAAGLLKAKISAVTLGPVGVGMLGLGGQVQLLGLTWGSLSIGSGFTQQCAAAIGRGDEAGRRDLLSTTFTTLFIFNFILVALGLALFPLIGGKVFGEQSHYLVPILLTIPFQVLVGAYFMGVLYAHGKYELWSSSSGWIALPELVLFALGAWKFGVLGALSGLALGMVLWSLLLLRHCLKVENAKDLFRFHFKWSVLRGLATSSLATSVTSSAAYLSGVLVRIFLVQKVSAEANGAYQAACLFSALYLPFVTNGIWAQLFPLVSASRSGKKIEEALSESIVVTAILGATCQLVLLLAPNLMVGLVLAKTFSGVMEFLPLQLVGDYFFLLAQPGLAVVLGLGQFKRYALVWCVYFSLLVALPYLALPSFGARSVSVAYLLANVLLAALSLGYYFSGRPKNGKTLILLLVALGAMVAGSGWMVASGSDQPNFWGRATLMGIALVTAVFVLGSPKLNWKTRLLNLFRLLMLKIGMEPLLLAASLRFPKVGWLTKVLPNHYQYPKPSLRGVERRGIRYELDIGDFLDWHVFYGQVEGAKNELYNLATAGGVVIDVGANIGETALELASRVGPTGKVFAFEPDPAIRAKCEKNFAINNFRNLRLVPLALSHENAVYNLFRVSERNPAGNRILTAGEEGNSVSVNAVPLDKFVIDEGIPNVSLIKIDVEGFEFNVLRGAEATLRRHRPKLFIELSDSNLRAQGTSPAELLGFLERMGYSAVNAQNGEKVSSLSNLSEIHFDIVCVNEQA